MSEFSKTLNYLERYKLINQLKILEALYPDEADHFSLQREALENGYEILYDWFVDYIADGDQTVSPAESMEVWDTMDMFDAINRAVEAKGIELGDQEPFAKFLGYDGNNETKFMAFAAFTVERLKRFEYIPMAKEGYWNSHMPVRAVYGRMLDEWKKVPRDNRFNLSSEQVKSILDAAIHPDHR